MYGRLKSLMGGGSRLRHSLTSATGLSALALLIAGVTTFGLTGIASASAPNQILDGNGLALNRKAGCTGQGCTIITYTNDGDNNEYFWLEAMDACGGSAAVSSTCPFTVGSGMNSGNEGDTILEAVGYSTSTGDVLGCVGTSSNSSYYGILTQCNYLSTGQGGGPGTMFVYGGAGGQIPDANLASRLWSDNYYADGNSYPVGLQDLGKSNQVWEIGAMGNNSTNWFSVPGGIYIGG